MNLRAPVKRTFERQKAKVKTTICIPGNWENNMALVTAVAGATEGNYMYAGTVLMDVKRKHSFEIEVCKRDRKLYDAFATAGMVTYISDETLRAVKSHNVVLYLTAETGSFGKAEAIARAAGALLKAGGLGLKVETTGKAFDADLWLNYLDDFETADLYKMFVVDSISENDGTVFSCGMHNLGLKDTIVSDEDFLDAVDLIRIFSYYQIVDRPSAIRNRDTFKTTADSPPYFILDEPNSPYRHHEFFSNPYGTWRLKRK